MKYLTQIICLTALLVAGCVGGSRRYPIGESDAVNERLARLEFGNVARITIFYEPEGVLTIESVDTEQLKTACRGTVTIRKFQNSKICEEFLSSLKRTAAVPSPDVTLDVRWGCILYDRHDNRLVSLYLNADGSGLVDQTKVRTDGKFLDYLRKEFRWLIEMW